MSSIVTPSAVTADVADTGEKGGGLMLSSGATLVGELDV
jgi:hypothetical protein